MTDDKILLFSDIHFGIEGDSDARLLDACKVLSWIASVAAEKNIHRCVFAGDWFHNRNEIDVRTILVAKAGLKILSETFDEFYLIAGNHDFYYSNDARISSASMFDDSMGAKIISAKPHEISVGKRKVLLAPWFYDPRNETEKYDALIGHFEFVGGRLAGGYSKVGYNASDMLRVAKLVFTGHYHLTNEQEYSSGKVVTIGSPYQHDWGDSGDDKRVIIFDGTSFESIYNTQSPVFKKFPYSKLEGLDDDTLGKVFSTPSVKNGFIRIISDVDNIDVQRLNKILEIGASNSVRKIQADLSSVSSSIGESIGGEMENLASKNIRSYVHDFVSAELEKNPDMASFGQEKVHAMVDAYFNRIEGQSIKEH